MSVKFGSPQSKEDYARLKRAWKNCRKCPLGLSATTHVLYRGRIPCDILFIGEAPGESEDACGYPFLGRAGQLLDSAIEEVAGTKCSRSYGITNILACIPWKDEVSLQGFRQPKATEISKCHPRLLETIRIANPKGIVLLGKVAEENGPTIDTCATIHLPHPSWVLRNGGTSSAAFKEFVSSLKRFVKSLKL